MSESQARWHRAARARWRGQLVVCLALLALSGCALDEPVATTETTPRVDEEEQGYRIAERTILDHCEPAHRRPGTRRPSHAAGAHAVNRIIRYVVRHNDDDYDTAIDNRRALADVAAYLEGRCLRDQVQHIDRALRVLPIPDVPYDYFEIDDYDLELEYGR